MSLVFLLLGLLCFAIGAFIIGTKHTHKRPTLGDVRQFRRMSRP